MRRCLGLVATGALLAVIAGLIFLATLPSVADAPARTDAILQAHHGVAADLSPDAKVAEAVVAVEDRRFYQHHGIDSLGLLRAGWDLLITGSPHGGATITEQLAQALYVPDDGSVGAELRKMGIAFKLEQRYSKARILAMYLNAIYFGDGQWGVAQASRAYFGSAPAALTWGEAALLAGLPNAPSAYDPTRHYALSRQRERLVLIALVRDGALTTAEADAIYANPPRIKGQAPAVLAMQRLCRYPCPAEGACSANAKPWDDGAIVAHGVREWEC